MDSGLCPAPDNFLEIVEAAALVPEITRSDTEVDTYWLVAFESEKGSFSEAWSRAVAESRDAIGIAREAAKRGSGTERYAEVVDRLGLCKPQQ